MDKKTTGIVATVASIILCGLPGLCFCLIGAITAGGIMPYNYEFGNQTSSGTMPTSWGYAFLCLALILILIPVLVGVLTLRKKPEAAATVTVPDEPLPPPS